MDDQNRSQWPRRLRRGPTGAHLLGSQVRIPFLFPASFVCCWVEVSAMGRSLVQRSRTERGVCDCTRGIS